MPVKKTTFPGFPNCHCYRVGNYGDLKKICQWMREHSVENIVLAAGSRGYVFQVKSNVEWFDLKWS